MSARTWIGDWFRARHDSGASDADAGVLAELFGLDGDAREAGPPVAAPAGDDGGHRNGDRSPEVDSSRGDPRGSGDEPRGSDRSLGGGGTPGDQRRTVLRVERLAAIAPASHEVPLPGLAPPVSRLPSRAVEPIFPATSTRALLGALAGVWREEGAVMAGEMLERVARGQAIRGLPRRRLLTVRAGLGVLLDHAAIAPFADDVIHLREHLRRVVGISAVSEWWLEPDGEIVPCDLAAPSWPPPAGRPVLAVTDRERRLVGIAGELRARGSELIVLVPRRDAPMASSGMTAIPWDERTRLGDVIRRRRRLERG